MFPKLKFTAEEIENHYAHVTPAMVRSSLNAPRHTFFDLLNLLSVEAGKPEYRDAMRDVSTLARRRHYGKTVSIFAPLYISNTCVNSCRYCDFNIHHRAERKTLTLEEIDLECAAIRKHGIDSLLIVAGEDPKRMTVDFLCEVGRRLKDRFSCLSLEVAPQEEDAYRKLFAAGFESLICFQETYHKENYNIYHPRGMKSRFEWRCNGFDRMGQAGVHSIGMGVLIGLEKEWRTDVTMMAYHLRYLQKHYWRTKYSVNFPRMRPAQNEGFQPNCIMTDRELAQATFAMRIFDHDVDISYSTREPAYIRDNMCTLGVTTMSAQSRVNPGGYHTYPQALEQFSVNDERTAKVIDRRLRELGREPVWKDWDASFDLFGKAI